MPSDSKIQVNPSHWPRPNPSVTAVLLLGWCIEEGERQLCNSKSLWRIWGSENVWEKQLCRATRVSEGGGAGGLREPEQRFPCSPGAAHGEAAVPLQPMEIHRGENIHPQTLEVLWSRQMFDGVYKPALEQDPGRICGSVERRSHASPGRTCDPHSDLWITYHGQDMGEVHGGLSSVGGTPYWSRGIIGHCLPRKCPFRISFQNLSSDIKT